MSTEAPENVAEDKTGNQAENLSAAAPATAAAAPATPAPAGAPSPNTSIAQILAAGETWVGTTAGTSMWPMLRNRRDTVVVRPATAPLRKYDVVLYVRKSDGAYILHRYIGPGQDCVRILGDNCQSIEYVAPEQIIGVLDEFWRGERKCDPHGTFWMSYARLWLATWPLRRAARNAKGKLRRLVRK